MDTDGLVAALVAACLVPMLALSLVLTWVCRSERPSEPH